MSREFKDRGVAGRCSSLSYANYEDGEEPKKRAGRPHCHQSRWRRKDEDEGR